MSASSAGNGCMRMVRTTAEGGCAWVLEVKSLQGSRQMRGSTSRLPALSSHERNIPRTSMVCTILTVNDQLALPFIGMH